MKTQYIITGHDKKKKKIIHHNNNHDETIQSPRRLH